MPKQILAADDSATMRKVFAITFAVGDYDVVDVPSAEDALRRAREIRPDVAILDAGMPGMDGYDLCAAFRADAGLRSVPVILLCSSFAPYDEARGQKAGVDVALAKPFDTQTLIDKVNQLCAERVGAAAPSGSPAPAKAATAAVETAPRPAPPGPAESPGEIMIEAEPPPPAAPAPPSSPPLTSLLFGSAAPAAVTPAPKAAPAAPAAVTPAPKAAPAAPAAVTPAPKAAPAAPAAVTPMPKAAPAAPAAVTKAPAPTASGRLRPSLLPGVPIPARVAPPVASTPGIPELDLGIPDLLGPVKEALAARTRPAGVEPPAEPAAEGGPPGIAVPSLDLTLPPEPAAAPPAPGAALPVPARSASSPAPAAASRPAARAVEATMAALAARGPEYEALAKLSREVIEQIAWEVVPELAEVIIRAELDRLVAERGGRS